MSGFPTTKGTRVGRGKALPAQDKQKYKYTISDVESSSPRAHSGVDSPKTFVNIKQAVINFLKSDELQTTPIDITIRIKLDNVNLPHLLFTDSPDYCFKSHQLASKVLPAFSKIQKNLGVSTNSSDMKSDAIEFSLTQFRIVWANTSEGSYNEPALDFDCTEVSMIMNPQNDPRTSHFRTKPFQELPEYVKLATEKASLHTKVALFKDHKRDSDKPTSRPNANTPGRGRGGQTTPSAEHKMFSLVTHSNKSILDPSSPPQNPKPSTQAEEVARKAAEIHQKKNQGSGQSEKGLASTTAAGDPIIYAKVDSKYTESGKLLRTEYLPQATSAVKDARIMQAYGNLNSKPEEKANNSNSLVKLRRDSDRIKKDDILTHDDFESTAVPEPIKLTLQTQVLMKTPNTAPAPSPKREDPDAPQQLGKPATSGGSRPATPKLNKIEQDYKRSTSRPVEMLVRSYDEMHFLSKTPQSKEKQAGGKTTGMTRTQGTPNNEAQDANPRMSGSQREPSTRLGKRRPLQYQSDPEDEVQTEMPQASKPQESDLKLVIRSQPLSKPDSPNFKSDGGLKTRLIVTKSIEKSELLSDERSPITEKPTLELEEPIMRTAGSAKRLGLPQANLVQLNSKMEDESKLLKAEDEDGPKIGNQPIASNLTMQENSVQVKLLTEQVQQKVPQRRQASRPAANRPAKQNRQPRNEYSPAERFRAEEAKDSQHPRGSKALHKPKPTKVTLQDIVNENPPSVSVDKQSKLRGKSMGPNAHKVPKKPGNPERSKPQRLSKSRGRLKHDSPANEAEKSTSQHSETGVRTRASKRTVLNMSDWGDQKISMKDVQTDPPVPIQWVTQNGWTVPMYGLPGEHHPLDIYGSGQMPALTRDLASRPKLTSVIDTRSKADITNSKARDSSERFDHQPTVPQEISYTPNQLMAAEKQMIKATLESQYSQTTVRNQQSALIKAEKGTETEGRLGDISQQKDNKIAELQKELEQAQQIIKELTREQFNRETVLKSTEDNLITHKELLSIIKTKSEAEKSAMAAQNTQLQEKIAALEHELNRVKRGTGSTTPNKDVMAAINNTYKKQTEKKPITFVQGAVVVDAPLKAKDSDLSRKLFPNSPHRVSPHVDQSSLKKEDGTLSVRPESQEHSVMTTQLGSDGLRDRSFSIHGSKSPHRDLDPNHIRPATQLTQTTSERFHKSIPAFESSAKRPERTTPKELNSASDAHSLKEVSDSKSSSLVVEMSNPKPISQMHQERQGVAPTFHLQQQSADKLQNYSSENRPLAKRTIPVETSMQDLKDFVTLGTKGLGKSLTDSSLPNRVRSERSHNSSNPPESVSFYSVPYHLSASHPKPRDAPTPK